MVCDDFSLENSAPFARISEKSGRAAMRSSRCSDVGERETKHGYTMFPSEVHTYGRGIFISIQLFSYNKVLTVTRRDASHACFRRRHVCFHDHPETGPPYHTNIFVRGIVVRSF